MPWVSPRTPGLGQRRLVRVLLVLLGGSVLLLAAKPAPPPPPSRLHKLTQILALEDARTAGGGELDRYLRDPDRSVRRRAALAAGRIADASVVPTLIDLMNDGEHEVRQMSAFAMGLVGDKLAVDRLVASLGDSDPVVRGRSAEALGRIGDLRAAPEVVRFVLAATPKGTGVVTVRGDDPGSNADPWLELRLALLALARLKDAKAAEAALMNGAQPRFDWWVATYAAMRTESPALKPVLLASARSDDPHCRSLAARGLGALKDAGTVDVLGGLTKDADEGVVVMALRALATVGDAGGVPAVASVLASPNLTLKREALRALAVLPADRSLREQLVPLVGHKEPWIRAAALQALARTDRDSFALVLSGLDPDPDWSVRAGLAAALGEAADEVSLGLLYGMLKDEDVRVLPAVLEAIRKARGNDAIDTLKRELEHPDFAVRGAAAEGIAALKAQGLSAALAAAYQRSRNDSEIDARLSEIAALAVQKDEAARATLEEIAKGDPVRAVRARAAAALAPSGQPPPPVGPETALRPFLDYRLAMAPYEPIPGVPLYTPRAFVHTRHGVVEIHLDVVETPLTSLSFMDLARRGFYDGLTFHRQEATFVVQGGCPRGDGNGGPGYTLRCEISQRPYGRGALGMALSGKDTGGSQFFITLSPQPHLDGNFTVFGYVVKGMDVVDKIRPGDSIERVEIWNGR
jgi:cyclophilin family peptidyl-prolyl cis-trans isomerase/HEAT repeat protein